VVDRLQTHGWRVRALTRQPVSDGLAFRLGDDVAPAQLAGADALVHCAYDFRVHRWPEIEAVNVHGTGKLFSAARQAGIKRLVCISTMSSFDGCRSLYGRAKLEIEKIAFAHGALVLRPGLIYGDGAGGMFGSLVRQVRKSSVVPLFGDGLQLLYLIHEQDLTALIHRYCCGEFDPLTEPVTAAHEQGWTFRQILEEIARKFGKRLRFVNLPWRLVWAAIKAAELLRLPSDFRSDSLVSLMNQNPHPRFDLNGKIGLRCRRFDITTMNLQTVTVN
jgi:nucleoside-diphosphate-sugar epimerase